MSSSSNMLRRGLERLAERRKEVATETITYSRSGVGSVSVQATPAGPTPNVGEPREGFIVDELRTDWIVNTADLVIGGANIEPESGDTITHDDGTTEFTFRVGPYESERAFRYTNQYAKSMRIHSSRQLEAES